MGQLPWSSRPSVSTRGWRLTWRCSRRATACRHSRLAMGFAHFVPAAPVATPPRAAELYVSCHMEPIASIPNIAIACTIVLFSASCSAADCQDGSPRPDKCLAELRSIEAKLSRVHAQEERRLASLFAGREEYEGSRVKEAVAAFRAEAAAWRRHRSAKCRLEALRDGMSVQYLESVTAACEVSESESRLQQLKRVRGE